MEKSKSKNVIVIVLIIVILSIIGIMSYFLFFSRDDNNFIKKLFNQESEEKTEIASSLGYNGVYAYKTELDKTYSISSDCQVSSLDEYIVVVNDDYFIYKMTCLGTYLENTGLTESLVFIEDGDDYKISYSGKEYTKDIFAKKFAVTSDMDQAKIVKDLDLKNLKFIIENTEFAGHYYNINSSVRAFSKGFSLIINFETYPYALTLTFKGNVKYTYSIYDLNVLPEFYVIDRYIAIIEKVGNRSILRIVNDEKEPGVIYNSDDNFPVVFDGITISRDNGLLIKYDQTNRVFNLLISKDSSASFCSLNSDSNDIVSYRYEIGYSSMENKWDTMKYVGVIRGKDGCEYVDKLVG